MYAFQWGWFELNLRICLQQPSNILGIRIVQPKKRSKTEEKQQQKKNEQQIQPIE